MMKCLFGTYQKDEGKILLNGKEISFSGPKDALENGIAMVHQELNQCLERNVIDNLFLGRYPTNSTGVVDEGRMKKKASELFRKLGMTVDLTQPMRNMSVSQRQMCEIAKAISYNSKVIVLDEPTSYLDIRHKIELLDILREMTASRGLSVVLSLHEVDLATKLADVVVLVKDNAIFRCGAPEDVLDDDTIRQLYDIHDGSFNLLLGSVELCGAAGEPRVFVVPGEGRGAPCFRALQKRGLPFAAGILQRCDVDWAVAETLAARMRRRAFPLPRRTPCAPRWRRPVRPPVWWTAGPPSAPTTGRIWSCCGRRPGRGCRCSPCGGSGWRAWRPPGHLTPSGP